MPARAEALRQPFDGLRDWPAQQQPAASPLRGGRTPLGSLDNIALTPTPTKPLPPAAAVVPTPRGDSPARGSPTHRVLAQWKRQQTQALPLRSTSIGAAEVTQSPSASACRAHKDWTMSADERVLRGITAGFTPPADEAERVPCLGIGKASTKAHDAQRAWLSERSRRKAAAAEAAAEAAATGAQLPRSRRWPALHPEDESDGESGSDSGSDSDSEVDDELPSALGVSPHVRTPCRARHTGQVWLGLGLGLRLRLRLRLRCVGLVDFGLVNPHPHPHPHPAQVADAFEHGSPLPREAEPKVGPTLTPSPTSTLALNLPLPLPLPLTPTPTRTTTPVPLPTPSPHAYPYPCPCR